MRLRCGLMLAVALLSGMSAAQGVVVISEDFESDTLGSFPASWSDVGPLSASAPIPSGVVVADLDAFGSPTQVFAVSDAVSDGQGIYLPIPTGTPQISISADVLSSG